MVGDVLALLVAIAARLGGGPLRAPAVVVVALRQEAGREVGQR